MGLLSNLASIGRRVDRLRDTMHKLDSILATDCQKALDEYERRVLRDVKDTMGDPTEHEVSLGMHTGKIPAIKAYRERTGAGLAEAKNIMEAYFTKKGYTFQGYPQQSYIPDGRNSY